MTITLSKEQQNAVNLAKDWYKIGNKQSFVIVGYAGTGKSSLVKFLIDDLSLLSFNIAYCAPTGKAALVMRRKGCYEATTIHKLIYEPSIFLKLKEEKEGDIILIEGLENLKLEPEYEEIVTFNKKPELDEHIRLIIIDEASMIGKDIKEDIESYDIPILYIGDHGQLPPVKSALSGIFDNPDIRFETIYRQAINNPILKVSMIAREGRIIPYGVMKNEIGGVVKIGYNQLDFNDLWNFNQILCYTNKQRDDINNKMRELLYFPYQIPVKGDRIVCRKNNYNFGLINGQQYFIKTVNKSDKHGFHYIMNLEDEEGNELKDLLIQSNGFIGRDLIMFGDFLPFQFAYCITVHTSQGSEWDKVLVFDNYPSWKKDYKNWLYTAITRASKEIVIVK